MAFNCSTVYEFRKCCAEHYQFHGKQMEIGCEKILCTADKWPTKCEKEPLRNSTFVSSSYCLIYLLHSLYTIMVDMAIRAVDGS